MSLSIGIDLGTTYSAAAFVNPRTGKAEIIPNPEGKNITPSVIYFFGGKIIFGSEAEAAFNEGLPGCAATFKRRMGKNTPYCTIDGHEYTAENLSSMILKYIRDYAESQTGQKIEDAVITVPAYFYAAEREATLRAANEAGLKVRKIIDEPNAAAIFYGLNHWWENANILVYDLGGGTFDVTLVHMHGNGELQTIVTRGDHFLGGRDWDDRLKKLMADKFSEETGINVSDDEEAMRILRGLSEGVKKKLSSLQSLKVSAELPSYGRAETKISRREFEECTSDLLRRTGDFCTTLLKDAEITTQNITAVLLVGGSTRMPCVSEYLTGMFGRKPLAHVNPDEAVALGAAIQATKAEDKYTHLSVIVKGDKKVTDRAKITGSSVKPERRLTGLEVISLRETTAHAMGMIAVSQDGRRYINDIIIPANHPRPVRAAKAFAFRTRSETANEMEIYVLQGDKEKPLENQVTFKYIVQGIKHKPDTRGKTVVKVQYIYDTNGIIHVEARQDDSSENLTVNRSIINEDMSRFGLPVEITEPEPGILNLAMAVDVSGSMSGEPLDDAKKAMCDFLDKFDFAYTRVGILVVSDNTKIVCNLTSSKSECLKAIRKIECGQTGYGNVAHPFKEIKSMLANQEGRRFAIVLADGIWYCQNKAVESAKQCNKSGIETAGIGFGSADEKFLRDISSSDANAVFVQKSGELGFAFGTIAQSLGGKSSFSNDGPSSSRAEDTLTWED